MTDRTLTALYETKDAAKDAETRLKASGVSADAIRIHDGEKKGDEGFFASIASLFGSHDDSHDYAEGVKRGHFLLSAKVPEAQTDAAIRVLDVTPAVDVDQKRSTWGARPSAEGGAGRREGAIPIVEERLVVGKREVERGGVRVRAYVVETPVSEEVRLRDETVDVQRRPVDRPVADGDDVFEERTIEMRETSEEAVVGKQAFVTEEIVLSKTVGEHVEQVKDTVRQTKVYVDRLPQDRRPERAG